MALALPLALVAASVPAQAAWEEVPVACTGVSVELAAQPDDFDFTACHAQISWKFLFPGGMEGATLWLCVNGPAGTGECTDTGSVWLAQHMDACVGCVYHVSVRVFGSGTSPFVLGLWQF